MQSVRCMLAALMLALPFCIFAEETFFPDVPPGAWYEVAVRGFLVDGSLDARQPRFRPGDPARRSEFVKLMVERSGGILDEIPESSRFADVAPSDWFFGVIEEAAREGWIKGDGDCALEKSSGKPPPCRARPGDPVTRAEAAMLLARAFAVKNMQRAPAFSDNPNGTWFADAVQAAADFCILRGDDKTRVVRPGGLLNRAEMVVVFARLDERRRYPDC